MPYNELQRRDSWPPTILRIHDNDDAIAEESDAIDENPFSFFLTSPEDIDDFLDDEEDLSAGIETPESKSPVREVSPSTIQRTPLRSEDEEDDDEDYDFGLAMPLTLKDFTNRHTSGRKSRQGQRVDSDKELKGLGIKLPSGSEFSASRGRAMVRLTPPSRNARGRGQTRSLSARRPQSWREPGFGIWTIREEDEDANAKVDETPISASAPSSTRIGLEEAMEGKKAKPKKRVHWAL